MDKIVSWFSQLRFDTISDTLIVLAASLLCITFHELCHGLAAFALGDRTAQNMGRLTLNPLKHIDLLGLISMALLHFGWAKPVPVDMRNFKHPKLGMAITALAGPMANVLLCYLAILGENALYVRMLLDAKPWMETVMLFLAYLSVISAGLAIFNIFPIPPLDGSKILFSLLPDRLYYKLMRVERFGSIVLLILLFTHVLDQPLLDLRQGLIGILQSASAWIFDPMLKLFS